MIDWMLIYSSVGKKADKRMCYQEHSMGDYISYITYDEKRTKAANQEESRTNHAGRCINAQRSQGDRRTHDHSLIAKQIIL